MSEENSSYRIVLIIVIAIVVVVGAIAAYVYFGREPNPYQGQILSVNVYPIHRDLTQQSTTEGMSGQKQTYDEVLVFADVSVKNTTNIPLYLRDMTAIADLPNETSHSSAASGEDFPKVFIAYPETRQYRKPLLARDTTIQPGQQVQGQMIFNFQMSKEQWQSASDVAIYLSFAHQNPLVMHLKAPPGS